MSIDGIAAADEGFHQPDGRPEWDERWTFLAGEGALSVDLVWHPHEALMAYRFVLRGPEWHPVGRALVLVEDRSVSVGSEPRLELRASGLWADHVCEEPLERWSLGVEAFGVALDEDADVELTDPYGHRCAVGADLEWEHTGAIELVEPMGYAAPCRVQGELLVDDRTYEIDWIGNRSHTWG